MAQHAEIKNHHATRAKKHAEVPVVTASATTRSLIGVAILTERGTTLPATQVCLRPVESGLGGHEEGVSVSTGSNHITFVMETGGKAIRVWHIQWLCQS